MKVALRKGDRLYELKAWGTPGTKPSDKIPGWIERARAALADLDEVEGGFTLTIRLARGVPRYPQ